MLEDIVTKTLHRMKVVCWYTGQILVWFSVILISPLIFVVFYPDEVAHVPAFLIPTALSLLTGVFFRKLSNLEKTEVLSPQEGTVVIVLAWVLMILFSALPFIVSGYLDFSQAIFEATSGWSTTGLTMFTNVEVLPRVFLVWRSLMQFAGGAGIAVMMLATLIGPLGTSLYSSEGRMDNILPNITESARIIMVIYSTYALFGVIALKLAGLPLFDAFNHSLTALATGGFSTRNASVESFNNPTVEVILCVLMFLGATGFGIHYTLWKGNIKAFLKNGEPWLMGSIILASVLSLLPKARIVFGEKAFRYVAFQVISALTGTGFSNTNLVRWPSIFPTGVFLLTVLMTFGGMMDSTSGGVKQFRLLLMLKLILHSIMRFVSPRRVVKKISVWKGDKQRFIDDETVKNLLVFLGLYVVVYLVGSFTLMLFGFDPTRALFEFASAMNGVGLSVGITNPDLPVGVIWTLILGMFLGRLEILVVFFAIARIIKDFKIVLTEA